MTTTLEPAQREADLLIWRVGDEEIVARRAVGGWRVERSWSTAPFVLAAEPRVALRLGEGEAVVHLDQPVSLPPGAEITLWLDWPLEIAILATGSEPMETWRRSARRTMLGSVEHGRVLTGVRCAAVADAADVTGPARAALRVVLANRGSVNLLLRRFPVAEGALPLWSDGARYLAGSVEVGVQDEARAGARIVPLVPPAGFTEVAPETSARRRPALNLDWLLDATRRSTEFQL